MLQSLFFPDPACHSQLQLLPVAAREEERHITMNDQTIIAVPYLPMAVSDASWDPLPYQFPAIATHFKTVTVVLCLIILTHESQECHIHWRHSQ